MSEHVIGFIGAGNMAMALAGGLLAQGQPPSQVWMSDVSAERLQALADRHGVRISLDNAEVARHADVLVLAVKPQVMAEVCRMMAPHLAGRDVLVISIAAGLPVQRLQSWLGPLPMVRVMPNTPAMVQAGATGLYAVDAVTPAQRDAAERILGSVGATVWLQEESLLDAVTAVSGSGPAYFFLLMEAMIAAGQELGLDADTARRLTLQTALGAARLALDSPLDPAALREQVTSPGGTTFAALQVFEQQGLRHTVSAALTACRDRARELGR